LTPWRVEWPEPRGLTTDCNSVVARFNSLDALEVID